MNNLKKFRVTVEELPGDQPSLLPEKRINFSVEVSTFYPIHQEHKDRKYAPIDSFLSLKAENFDFIIAKGKAESCNMVQ